MDVPTLGIEEEFLLVDAGTGGLREDAEVVLQQTGDDLDHELRSAMVETGSAVCADLATASAELSQRRAAAVAAAARVGARVLATGSHPTATPHEPGYGDEPRYRRIAEAFGVVSHEALVCGCHVHVAVPDREAGVAVVDRVRPWLGPLVALSVNSPLWQGQDTGYHSWRTQVWSRWPTAGPTSLFHDLTTYDARADALVACGAAIDRAALYYEVRLSEQWPTVEVRVGDVCLEVDDAVLLGGLARALVMTALADRDRPAPDVPVELLRAATFQASHAGLSGELVDPVDWQLRPAAAVLELLVEHVGAALEHAGDAGLVTAGIARLQREGSGADRQRNAFQRAGSQAVIDLVTLQPASS